MSNVSNVSKMNQEVNRKWIKALTSRRYEQAKNALRVHGEDGKDRFCCLGVLCDLYANETANETANEKMPVRVISRLKWSLIPGSGTMAFGKEKVYPPSEVLRWAGIDEAPPPEIVPNTDAPANLKSPAANAIYKALAWHNDRGRTFEEIAALIHDYL